MVASSAADARVRPSSLKKGEKGGGTGRGRIGFLGSQGLACEGHLSGSRGGRGRNAFLALSGLVPILPGPAGGGTWFTLLPILHP